MKQILHITILSLALANAGLGTANAQSCTPLGNQTTYGTNNVWIGYVYQGMNFNTYKGYVNEGTASNPNFDESFGGNSVNYATNGCSVYTDTFSVRYKLTQNFADGDYDITVGADDGYRFSIDGGATWVINRWVDQSYASTQTTVHLNGTYNLVLEFYEHFISNRVTFSIALGCVGSGNPATYGTNNVWQSYLYQGMNFQYYKGFRTEGTAANPNFDESFGGNNVNYATSNCSVVTELFSARFRLQKTFTPGTYTITVGGDDGYRLSLDGGATWVINKWFDQSYAMTSYMATLNGTYNMVLEYYENGGGNRISFVLSGGTLPVKLMNWSATAIANDKVQLSWSTASEIDFSRFVVQRSTDGQQFSDIATVVPQSGNSYEQQSYGYTDQHVPANTVYYRLAMIDQDGTVTYSTIETVTLRAITGTKIYPTVVEDGQVFVETDRKANHAQVQLFDMNGRKLWQTAVNLNVVRKQLTLPASAQKGAYVVLVSDNDDVLARKVVMVK